MVYWNILYYKFRLADKGYEVFGAEASEQAVSEIFTEAGLSAKVTPVGNDSKLYEVLYVYYFCVTVKKFHCYAFFLLFFSWLHCLSWAHLIEIFIEKLSRWQSDPQKQ